MVGVSQEGSETIVYKILETGEEKTVQLTNGETDPDQGKISRISPVGMALLRNKKVGGITEVETNQKKYQVQILQIVKK